MSKAEEFVIRMLIDRVKLAKQLTRSQFRLRRAYFMLRNMFKVVYRPVTFGTAAANSQSE